MKRQNFIIIISLILICIFFLSACDDNRNLPEMTYDFPDSAISMTLNGEKYICVGPLPHNIEMEQKVARVRTSNGLPKSYVYKIKGYDEKDFLVVEERTVGVVFDVYCNERITSIPWELLDGNVMVSGDEYINYNGKKYYYFSKAPDNFSVEKELSALEEYGKILQVYKIANQSEDEWIAIKDDSYYKEGYLLYWIRETSLPRQYIEIWRTYGK